MTATRAVCWLEQSKRRSHTDIAAALVLMQAAQLLPGQTRNVPEPTAGPTAAAVSCMHHMQAGADDVTRLAID